MHITDEVYPHPQEVYEIPLRCQHISFSQEKIQDCIGIQVPIFY